MPQMPNWALQLSSSLKDANIKSIHQLMLKLVCSALGIHPSSSPSTTSRRILAAAKTSKFEPGSAVFQLVNSRTCRCLFDALKEKPVPQVFVDFLGSSASSGITSPAAQEVDEFPLRKVQVFRSSSVQFHNDRSFGKRSQSTPNIQEEIIQPQSVLSPPDHV